MSASQRFRVYWDLKLHNLIHAIFTSAEDSHMLYFFNYSIFSVLTPMLEMQEGPKKEQIRPVFNEWTSKAFSHLPLYFKYENTSPFTQKRKTWCCGLHCRSSFSFYSQLLTGLKTVSSFWVQWRDSFFLRSSLISLRCNGLPLQSVNNFSCPLPHHGSITQRHVFINSHFKY